MTTDMAADQAKIFKNNDYRLPVAILAAAVLALFFWLGSRYPALNQKAMMGGDTPVSGLSFDIFLTILPDSGVIWTFVANTANWIYTNIKGMTFGVLFGAAALTLLSLIKKRSFENSFANSALGTVIGAPLGVCVNCAAPIALGLHMGRMRLETTLSALLSSPTLNVIVVTMSFALLPFHLAAIKLLLALLMVLLVVPLLCKYVLVSETEATRQNTAPVVAIAEPKGLTAWIARMLAPADAQEGKYGPFASLIWFIKNYGRNFFFVFIITVPMMLLAALLGAIVATFVAPNQLVNALPIANPLMVFAALFIVAALASFVPAPIALDVILTIILLNVGMRGDYAMAALIGLGSFSVYAFIILWKAISLRTALVIWIAVVSMAIIGGMIANRAEPYVERYYFAKQIEAIKLADNVTWPVAPLPPKGKTIAELQPLISAHKINTLPMDSNISSSGNSEISVQQYQKPEPAAQAADSAAPDGPNFKRITGTAIGLDEKGTNDSLLQLGYHYFMGALAAGDVHGDGWTDIITRRTKDVPGVSMFANIGGKFVRQELDLGPVNNHQAHNIALVDVDGDGALDLLVATMMGGDYLFYNRGGSFDKSDMVALNEPGLSVSSTLAFADMDQDGDVDIITGRWVPRGSVESWRNTPVEANTNRIWWNDGRRKFRKYMIPGPPGQTLTTLVSDINNDGLLDLYVGDDTGFTDTTILFDRGGKIRKMALADQPFPYHTTSSMSMDEGDWDNDLRTDYYAAQIAFNLSSNSGQIRTQEFRETKRDQSDLVLFQICKQFAADIGWNDKQVNECIGDLKSADAIRDGKSGTSLDGCERPWKAKDRALCGAFNLLQRMEDKNNKIRKIAGDPEKHKICREKLKNIPSMRFYCDSLLIPTHGKAYLDKVRPLMRPTLTDGNILFSRNEQDQYTDHAAEKNVRFPGWSWNSRFADLDQDGWQDILVMSGSWLEAAGSSSNIFYHNNRNGFDDATDAFGFTDIVPSLSYVSFDYDRDGDVDVIRDISGLRMIVHRNDRPAGPALLINLRNKKGNSYAIGSRVTICTDGETQIRKGRCQMRHIKASGGYMSANIIAAHFGLGNAKSVSLIEIRWPDGETSRIMPRNLSSGEIVINRK